MCKFWWQSPNVNVLNSWHSEYHIMHVGSMSGGPHLRKIDAGWCNKHFAQTFGRSINTRSGRSSQRWKGLQKIVTDIVVFLAGNI